MHTNKLRTAGTSLRTRAAALAAIGMVGMTFAAADAAHAQPKGGAGQAKGCPVEDANGTTSTVAVGTRIGLFVCGSDGEWHFGWAVTANAPTAPAGTKPVLPAQRVTNAPATRLA